jgi:hypothetical protein
MPTYDAHCKICDKTFEYTSKIADRDTTPLCCYTKTERVTIVAPLGVVDNPMFMTKYKKLYNGSLK